MNRFARVLGFPLAFMVLGGTSMGAFCAPGGGPPAPDACDEPQTRAVVDALEIGQPDGDRFVPLPDGWVAKVIHGPQGGAMVEFRLRVTGSAPPECLEQMTTVTLQGTRLAARSTPLHTYPDVAGTRATRVMQVIFDTSSPPTGQLVEITAVAGGQTVTRPFYIDSAGN